MTRRHDDQFGPDDRPVDSTGENAPRTIGRRAIVKAAWTVPVVASLGSLEFGKLRGQVTSPVGGGGGQEVTEGGEQGANERGREGMERGREQSETGGGGLGGALGGGSAWW